MKISDPFKKSLPAHLPKIVRQRLMTTMLTTQSICEEAQACIVTKPTGGLSFVYEMSPRREFLTKYEEAQAYCFAAKYKNLPVMTKIRFDKEPDGYHLANEQELRQILNEYRPVIQNRNDSVFYRNIHRLCCRKVLDKGGSSGLTVTIQNDRNIDCKSTFLVMLKERIRAIDVILSRCEYGYIYNGILQHSDHRYTNRLWSEMESGAVNHVFLKHAYLLRLVKNFLMWHNGVLDALTAPKLGPL